MHAGVVGSWVARRRAAEEAARKSEQSGQPQAKKKRKRKVRHPKDFDPANPGPMPHPERWLPKWQRSDFKKKRKTRKEKQVCHSTLRLPLSLLSKSRHCCGVSVTPQFDDVLPADAYLLCVWGRSTCNSAWCEWIMTQCRRASRAAREQGRWTRLWIEAMWLLRRLRLAPSAEDRLPGRARRRRGGGRY